MIDLDGPNYPFLANLAIVASAVTGRPLSDFSATQDEWSGFIDNWGITMEQFYVLFALGLKEHGLMWEGDPVEGAVEGWVTLAAKPDTYLHVVTARMPFGAEEEAREATHFWLATLGLYADQISFRDDKVNAVRENIFLEGMNEEDLRIMTIDDKPDHCIAYADAGWESYVFDLPSNRHVDLPRVGSMLEWANLTS